LNEPKEDDEEKGEKPEDDSDSEKQNDEDKPKEDDDNMEKSEDDKDPSDDKKDFQECVNSKVPKLLEEGVERDQAIAQAISMCETEGKCSATPEMIKEVIVSFNEKQTMDTDPSGVKEEFEQGQPSITLAKSQLALTGSLVELQKDMLTEMRKITDLLSAKQPEQAEEEPKEESAPREAELVLPEEERSPSAVSSEESSELVMLEKPSSEASVSSDETLATAAPKRSSPTSSDSSDVVLVDRPSIEDTRETASTKTGVQVQETSPADEKSEKPSVVPVPPVTQESVEKGEDVEDKIAERTEPKPQQSLDTEGSVPEQVVEEKTEETIVDSLARQVEAQVRIPSDKIDEKAPESEPQVPAAVSKKEDVKEVGEPLLLAGAKEGEIE